MLIAFKTYKYNIPEIAFSDNGLFIEYASKISERQ